MFISNQLFFRVSDTQLWRVKWVMKKLRKFWKCTLVQGQQQSDSLKYFLKYL